MKVYEHLLTVEPLDRHRLETISLMDSDLSDLSETWYQEPTFDAAILTSISFFLEPLPIHREKQSKTCFAIFEELLGLWVQMESEKSIAICLQYESPFVRVFCWFCGFCWFVWPCCCCMATIFCFSLYSTWPCCKFTGKTCGQTKYCM